MPLFRKKKVIHEDNQVFSFLSEDERVLRELDSEWRVVRHGRKFVWHYGKKFRFGNLKKLLLTNKRLILLEGCEREDREKEIDLELPLINIKTVGEKLAGGPITWIPYLRIVLKDGEAISLVFVRVGTKKHTSEKESSYLVYVGRYMVLDTRKVINQWVKSIDNLIPSKH